MKRELSLSYPRPGKRIYKYQWGKRFYIQKVNASKFIYQPSACIDVESWGTKVRSTRKTILSEYIYCK